MSGRGIILGAIVCVPLSLIVISLAEDGSIALITLGVVCLGLSGLVLFLVLIASLIAKLGEKDSDEYIVEIPKPNIQSKIHPKDTSKTDTPA